MKWFRHESRAHRDAKLQKLMIRYGFEGYGLYWYCIENVCSGLEPDLTFELEQDAEILAHVGKMDSRKIEEILRYMVALELFEVSNNTITCLKLARFLGESGTRNETLKALIKDAKTQNTPLLSQTVSDSHKQSQYVTLREDKIREDNNKNRRFAPPTLKEVTDYCTERGNSVEPQRFLDHYEANGWMRGKNKIKDWKACVRTWERNTPASAEVSYW